MTMLWRDAIALARKDVRVEVGAPSALTAAFALGALGILVAALAIGPSLEVLRAVAPALTWLAFLYAAIAVGDRLDGIDRADDALSAVWLVIEDRRAIYLGRWLALTALLSGLLVVLWGLSIIVLAVDGGPRLVGLPFLLVLSAAAVSAATALVVATVGGNAARALLLPVLLLPLLIPTLLAAVQATGSLVVADGDGLWRWTTLLAAQLALFVGVGLITYEHAAMPE